MCQLSKRILIPLLFLLAACQKDIRPVPVRPEFYGLSSGEIFEAFWNGMNVNYPLWDVDSTNWDDVYRKYQPLFARLDATLPEDIAKANGYFREMLSRIQEGHLYLDRQYWDGQQYQTLFVAPVTERLHLRSDYHDSVPVSHFMEKIPSNYLQPGYVTGFVPRNPDDPNSFDDVYVVSGVLKQKPVLYLHISSFQMKDLYGRQDGNTVKKAIQHYFGQLAHLPANTSGLIIDVRGNGGGSTADLDFIIGRLVEEKYVYGANRFKSGNGRLDYGPWIPAYVNPPEGSKAFNKPVIVLCDIFTGSMAEATTMAVKALPNGKAAGERTFGRTAGIFENLDANGGKFSFEEGKSSVTFGASAFRFKDGSRYEGIGVPPDVPVPYNKAAIIAGRDPQLEKALELIP